MLASAGGPKAARILARQLSGALDVEIERIAELATRWHRRRNPSGDPERLKQMGLLFSAGLIAGEAIVGVLMAIPIVLSKDANVLAVAESLEPGPR